MLSRKSDKPHSFNMNNFKFNPKQVKQKPVEVCITWKVIGFLEFYIFPGYKNINRLYGAVTQWLRSWIPNPDVSCTKLLSGSKVDSAFHLTEVDTRVPGMNNSNF